MCKAAGVPPGQERRCSEAMAKQQITARREMEGCRDFCVIRQRIWIVLPHSAFFAPTAHLATVAIVDIVTQ